MESQSSNKSRRKSSIPRMPVTNQDLVDMDPEEIFEWEVDNLDAGLDELGITVGTKWSKSKKAYELNKAILEVKPKNFEQSKPMDSNIMMMQLMQTIQ